MVQLLAGSPDNRNNNDATDLCSLDDLLATQTAMTHLRVIWNEPSKLAEFGHRSQQKKFR